MKNNSKPFYEIYKKQEELNVSLCHACWKGDLNEVKYLLNNKKLRPHAKIYYENNYPLLNACSGGQLEVVKYLLNTKEIWKYSKTTIDYKDCFLKAGENGKSNIFDYLVDYLKHDNNIEIYINESFKAAFKQNEIEFIQHLIFDFGIKLSDEIRTLLNRKISSYHDSMDGSWSASYYKKVILFKTFLKQEI